MLSLKIRRRLEAAWTPLNKTVEEGLAELEQLCVMEVFEPNSGETVCRQLPEPNSSQAELLKALGVEWPEKLGPSGPEVVTRKKLQKSRKKAVRPRSYAGWELFRPLAFTGTSVSITERPTIPYTRDIQSKRTRVSAWINSPRNGREIILARCRLPG